MEKHNINLIHSGVPGSKKISSSCRIDSDFIYFVTFWFVIVIIALQNKTQGLFF